MIGASSDPDIVLDCCQRRVVSNPHPQHSCRSQSLFRVLCSHIEWPMSRSTLTLKQRLAALHVHSPGSSSSHSSASVDQLGRSNTVGPKWRTFLPRRSTESDLHSVLGQDRVQEVLSRLVFQAGVDFESVCHRLARCARLTICYFRHTQDTTNVGLHFAWERTLPGPDDSHCEGSS